ncbi:MAG: PAS domain-containing sensor histidine kinase, partial [Deferrisomatales bacterium]
DELEVRVAARTTELTEANAALTRDAEERLRAEHEIRFQARLLDAVEQAVIATDPEGRIVYWNRYAETLYGWRAEEARGRTADELPVQGAAHCQTDELLTVLRQGESWTGELSARRRNGELFPALVACSPMRSPSGELEGVVSVTADITLLKDAEEAVRYSEQKYSTVVESSLTGIFIHRGGRLVFVNRRLAEMLGCPPEELTGTESVGWVHPDDRPWVEEVGRRRTAGEEAPAEYEARLVTRAGETLWVLMSMTLIRYRGESSTLGSVQDITRRKKMELELRELPVRVLAAQEEERARVARELHDGLGQMLTALKFSLESVVPQCALEEHAAQRAALQALVPRIREAIDEVRRIATGLRPSTLDDLGLLPTLSWLCREFETTHPGIRIERTVGVEEKRIDEAQKTVIYRVLQEALTNVAKHSRADRVSLALREADGAFVLEVRDNGVGFDPEAAGAGRGFGLRSMRERTVLSGGELALETAAGAGTAVRARWPAPPRPAKP